MQRVTDTELTVHHLLPDKDAPREKWRVTRVEKMTLKEYVNLPPEILAHTKVVRHG